MSILFTIGGFTAGAIVSYCYEKAVIHITKKDRLVVLGYRLHHSLYGLLFLSLSLLFTFDINGMMALSFFGMGIIAQHCLTGDGLVFVTREG